MTAMEWTLKEYERLEPDRVKASELNEDGMYYLGLPNRASMPDAIQYRTRIRRIKHEMGIYTLDALTLDEDLAPRLNFVLAGTMSNDYLILNRSIKARSAQPGSEIFYLDLGYFLPYRSELDDELIRTVEELKMTV